jgi:putative transposase
MSITMEAGFGVEALNEALAWQGAPEIVHTGQGSEFSSIDFVKTVKGCGAIQRMDRPGCRRDNVFVERLWRSAKHEEFYLHAFDSGAAASAGIARHFNFCNTWRLHQTHSGRALDVVTSAGLHRSRRRHERGTWGAQRSCVRCRRCPSAAVDNPAPW